MRVIPWKETRDELVRTLVERIEITLEGSEDDIILRATADLLDKKGLHTTAKNVRRIADQMTPFEERT